MTNRIVELVNLWAQYEAESPGMTIEDFCVKHLARSGKAQGLDPGEESLPDWVKTQPDITEEEPSPWINSELSRLIGKLIRYVHFYSKKAFQEAGAPNFDDVLYVGVIQFMGNPRKSELIYEMLAEFPTGMEVIKRLVKQGYVEESPDEQDRRSKRLRATEAGVKLWLDLSPRMEQVGGLAFDFLNDAEKRMLRSLLDRLERFHADHFKALQKADFETLHRKMRAEMIR